MTGIQIANYENNADEEIFKVIEILLKAPTVECLCFVYALHALMPETLHKYLFLHFNVS